MAFKHGEDEKKEAPLWMISFTDIMTLLLTFFVLLITFKSFRDEELHRAWIGIRGVLGHEADRIDLPSMVPDVKGAVNANARTSVRPLNPAVMGSMENIVRKHKAGPFTAILSTLDGCRLRIRSDFLFKAASAEIDKAVMEFISDVALTIRRFGNRIIVEGHSDPWESGLAGMGTLDLDRATAVWELFMKLDFGQAAGLSSYGGERPVGWEDTVRSRSGNRRIEILVLPARRSNGPEKDQ